MKKRPKKGSKKYKKYFIVLNRYQSVTHVSTSILLAISYFFFKQTGLFTALYPTHASKKCFYKKTFKLLLYLITIYYSLNVTEFHGDGVKNESARPKNREKGWGGDAERPPQRAACLGLNTFNTTN